MPATESLTREQRIWAIEIALLLQRQLESGGHSYQHIVEGAIHLTTDLLSRWTKEDALTQSGDEEEDEQAMGCIDQESSDSSQIAVVELLSHQTSQNEYFTVSF